MDIGKCQGRQFPQVPTIPSDIGVATAMCRLGHGFDFVKLLYGYLAFIKRQFSLPFEYAAHGSDQIFHDSFLPLQSKVEDPPSIVPKYWER